MKKIFMTLLLTGSSLAFAYPDTSHMTCAQAKAFVHRHHPATLATGQEWGTFSFAADECSSGLAAYVCTKDVHFCNLGYSCQGYASLTPPAGYYQGTNFCNAPKYTE